MRLKVGGFEVSSKPSFVGDRTISSAVAGGLGHVLRFHP